MHHNPQAILRKIDACLEAEPRICLSKLSRALGVDRHTLESAVRQCKGIHFRKYCQQKILELIFHLLSNDSTLSLKEVAFTLGLPFTRKYSWTTAWISCTIAA